MTQINNEVLPLFYGGILESNSDNYLDTIFAELQMSGYLEKLLALPRKARLSTLREYIIGVNQHHKESWRLSLGLIADKIPKTKLLQPGGCSVTVFFGNDAFALDADRSVPYYVQVTLMPPEYETEKYLQVCKKINSYDSLGFCDEIDIGLLSEIQGMAIEFSFFETADASSTTAMLEDEAEPAYVDAYGQNIRHDSAHDFHVINIENTVDMSILDQLEENSEEYDDIFVELVLKAHAINGVLVARRALLEDMSNGKGALVPDITLLEE